MRRVLRRRERVVVLALLGALAACGGGGGSGVDDLVLGTSPPRDSATTVRATPPSSDTAGTPGTAAAPTSTELATTTTVDLGEWVPVTGNLVGLSSECGNVRIDSQPSQDLLVASVARNGLWSLTPGTDEWTALGAGGEPIRNRTAGILADPDDPNRYWQSGNYGDVGVYRTDDRGQSFRQLGTINHLDYVGVDFSDPERRTLLAGTHENSVLYRSTDGGETWSEVTTLPDGIGFAAAPWVVDTNTYLLATHNGDADGIFRSVDAGATWTRVFDGAGVVGMPVVHDGKISWLMELGGGLVTSDDDGETWTAAPANGAIAVVALQLVALPDGSLATISNDHVIRTTDDGATWQPVGPPVPYPPQGIAYSAGEETFYVSRYDCNFTDDNPVPPDGILRLTP
jgi:photosystem II stability/assembly factor-like uncharacterized protein